MTSEQYLRFFEDLRRIDWIWKWPHGGAQCGEREGGEPQRPYPSADEVVGMFNDCFRRTCEETECVSNDL